MSHWSYVFAAYAITATATAAILIMSYVAMRRAEKRVDDIGQDK